MRFVLLLFNKFITFKVAESAEIILLIATQKWQHFLVEIYVILYHGKLIWCTFLSLKLQVELHFVSSFIRKKLEN